MRKRKLFSLLALLAALTLVAAACGDDDDDGDDGAAPTGETPAATDGGEDPCAADEFGCAEVAAGDPIRIGSLLAISGDVAFLGTDSNNGIILAIDNLDGALDGAPGQLLGHDVELQQEDDGCSAEGGQAGATGLVGDPSIVAVIGTSCSSSALGVADELTSEIGMLLFSPSNTNPALTAEGTHQAFYARTAHNDRIQGAIAAEFVFNELGLDTAATINDESPYADGLAAAFRTNFEALGGTITATEQVNSGDTDLGPVLRSIAEGNPGVVYGPNFNPVCALTYSQGADIFPDGTEFMGADGCLETGFIDTAGSPDADYYASSPDVAAFQAGEFYRDQFLPAYRDQFGGAPTSVFHAHAFDASNVLFQAIEQVAVDDGSGNLLIPRTALKDAVFATSGYEGLTGTITCTELGDCATDVTIGIFQYPNWPVEGGEEPSDPVYTDTKSLADVA
ncbi:MAG TPA: branched-chain amino acid ABC transporter substrate-binding protein [Actinomycetota bacterium]|nr:branched-chain amino acid ABC transporter substrate-binding protein [Actinomycetota bacterium]